MYLDVFQGCIGVMRQENTGRRTIPGSHGQYRAGNQLRVLPAFGQYSAVAQIFYLGQDHPHIAAVVDQTTGFRLESDADRRAVPPSFSFDVQRVTRDFILHPRRQFQCDLSGLRIVGNDGCLCDMRLLKVDGEIFQSAVLAAE